MTSARPRAMPPAFFSLTVSPMKRLLCFKFLGELIVTLYSSAFHISCKS